MIWPFNRNLETRESSYTDALVRTIVQSASASTFATPTATGALEASAAIVARSFAAASVEGAPVEMRQTITKACLSMIGRSLIRQGEIVFRIDVVNGQVRLIPAASWDVSGGPDPSTWFYRLTIAGPDKYSTVVDAPADSVVHVRLQADPATPWRGVAPLEGAAIAGRLSAETMSRLSDEASGPVGHFLPLPVDGNDPTVTALRADVKGAKGQQLVVESSAAGWAGDAAQGAPKGDWLSRRFGPNPPPALIAQAELASREVFAACGIPQSLVMPSGDTGAREAYRQLMFSTVQPMSDLVVEELRTKLDDGISLDHSASMAADLSGRARAFQSLVNGGMSLDKAASLAGLLAED